MPLSQLFYKLYWAENEYFVGFETTSSERTTDLTVGKASDWQSVIMLLHYLNGGRLAKLSFNKI